MFLGLNLVLLHVNYLPLQLEQSGAVEVSVSRYAVIERSNQGNFSYFFFFLKRKRKVIEGILTVCRKKLKLYGILEMNHLIKSCDQRKWFSLSQESDMFAMQCSDNLHKKK